MTTSFVRSLWAGFAISIFALSACNDSTIIQPAKPPATLPGAAPGFTQATESVQCEAVNPSSCQGFYGFSVFSNGNYQAGPAGDGSVATGTISPTELNTIFADGALLVASNAESANEECQNSQSVPGFSDQVQMRFIDTNSSVIYERNLNQVCYRGGISNSQKFHADINQLLLKYYPLPFPQVTPTPVPTITVPVPSPSPTAQNGRWGTDGAQLDVTSVDSVLNYDCSRGDIPTPLTLDSNGNFDVNGTVYFTGGPVLQNPPHFAAEFYGNVLGNEMHINVTYQDKSGMEKTFSYILISGNPGKLGICPL